MQLIWFTEGRLGDTLKHLDRFMIVENCFLTFLSSFYFIHSRTKGFEVSIYYLFQVEAKMYLWIPFSFSHLSNSVFFWRMARKFIKGKSGKTFSMLIYVVLERGI